MSRIPHDRSLESTVALLRDPYRFILKRCQRYGSDVFQARLALRPTLCLLGPAAAEVFYDPQRFERSGVLPDPIQRTLFGRGGVQGLDDAAHRQRKQSFLALMTPERVAQLGDLSAEWWRVYAERWMVSDSVVLHDEVREILCRAVCAWAGVPLPESDVGRVARDLARLVEGAATLGPRHWQARAARRRLEAWLAGLILDIRAGRQRPDEASAAHVFAQHRELNGEWLSPRVAAVELLNVLRPTVAVSVFITFSALALQQCPQCRPKLADGDRQYAQWFVHEVRRFYPFAPFVAARVRRDFDWNGYHFPQGRLALLALFGTNHDARTWRVPETFQPERFQGWNGHLFNFIPQGGGDLRVTHRCAGEAITMALMQVALEFLTRRLVYDVPNQDLRLAWSRFPVLPRSRFVIRHVRGDV